MAHTLMIELPIVMIPHDSVVVVRRLVVSGILRSANLPVVTGPLSAAHGRY